MCEDCGGICAILDRMIGEFLEAMAQADSGKRRPYFHPMEINGKTSQGDSTKLSELVEESACINMTPQELEQEIAKRSGFGDNVRAWLREEKVPNGMARKIILTNAEMIIRERGAVPKLTLLVAA